MGGFFEVTYKSFAGAGTNKFVLKSDRFPRIPSSPNPI